MGGSGWHGHPCAEVCEEGVRIPGVKLVGKGEWNSDMPNANKA